MTYLIKTRHFDGERYNYVVVKMGLSIEEDTLVMYFDANFNLTMERAFPTSFLMPHQIIQSFKDEGFKEVSNEEFNNIREDVMIKHSKGSHLEVMEPVGEAVAIVESNKSLLKQLEKEIEVLRKVNAGLEEKLEEQRKLNGFLESQLHYYHTLRMGF